MAEKKDKEQSFELRSEKVRSIVGEIPSSLIRYGIVAIGYVLICLFGVAHFLPFKQVYVGTATVYEINSNSSDSTDIIIHLNFENKRPDNVDRQKLYLQTPRGISVGHILYLSSIRDTLDRQSAICRFKVTEIKSIENQTVNFQIVSSSGNLLQKMLGKL